jgi:hypothetical protein
MTEVNKGEPRMPTLAEERMSEREAKFSNNTPRNSGNSGLIYGLAGLAIGAAIGVIAFNLAYSQPRISRLRTGYETRITTQQRYQEVQDSTAIIDRTASQEKIDSLESRLAVFDEFFPNMDRDQLHNLVWEHNDYQSHLVNMGLVKFDEQGKAYDVK